MMRTNKLRLAALGLVLLTAGCVPRHGGHDEETARLASALTKFSAAAESAARYKYPPADLTDEEFLAFATIHDPELLAPFRHRTVKVRRANRHSILLVCDGEGGWALLEDAGVHERAGPALPEGPATLRLHPSHRGGLPLTRPLGLHCFPATAVRASAREEAD